MQRRKKSTTKPEICIESSKRPVLQLRKRKSSVEELSSDRNKEKKKEKKQKKKENKKNNNNNIIYNKASKLKNKPYTSYKPNFSDLEVENRSDSLRNKNEKKGSTRSLRSKLNNTLVPVKRKKQIKVKAPNVEQKIQNILNLWDKLADDYPTQLRLMRTRRKDTKIYRKIISVVRSLLNGKILENRNIYLPQKINFEIREFTEKDFVQFLSNFEKRIINREFNFKSKIDLFLFLAGNTFFTLPSILLTSCLQEKEIKTQFPNYMPLLKKQWLSLGGNTLKTKDYENFDIYLCWALPYFKKLKRNLDSLNSFDDEIDVMDFFTFGTLRKFKERGKSFNTGILNQDFFKTMMEDMRKFHGYVV